MPDAVLANPVEAVRCFTRFYTRRCGALDERLLNGPFSLTEARVVYELAHHETATAAEMARELSLDASYLSRLLKSLQRRGYIERHRSTTDGRQNVVLLTEQGKDSFALINGRSQQQVAAMLHALSADDRRRLGVHAT